MKLFTPSVSLGEDAEDITPPDICSFQSVPFSIQSILAQMTQTAISADTTQIHEAYHRQHKPENLQKIKASTAVQRIEKIRSIERYLLSPSNMEEWTAALHLDLHKSREEAITTELTPLLANMRHIYKNLREWMSDRSVGSPWVMTGMSSHIRYEPKGHVMVIAPWNYPLFLVLNPLIYAIAAGNAVLVKPSEMAPATAQFITKMLRDLFPPEEVVSVEGGVEVSTDLLEQQFDHIFFTGSPKVGKIVMKAASKNLTSVTLELGGKSPVAIDTSANINTAAERIAWGKCVNVGQTCIAPDYALVHETQVADFVEAYTKAVAKFYNASGKGISQSPNYGRIVNKDHFGRLMALVNDAVDRGAKVELGGLQNAEDLLFEPFLLTEVTPEMKVMQEEIFGPILPVLTYPNWDEVPEIINQFKKPLALYVMSKNKKRTEYLLQNTSSGGVGINELLVTVINPSLPFGGVNHSGIGKSHGLHGFVGFSNERGVVKRNWLDFKMIYPPYNSKLINLLAKIARW